MNGIFLVNKPTGITSHDVIDRLREVTGERRIGHAGTLDPMASGLLIVAVGRKNTKQLSEYVGLDKVYEAEITLGAVSDTYDAEGVLSDYDNNDDNDNDSGKTEPDKQTIQTILNSFMGEQMQMPPAYSAKKIKGKKAYELARASKATELKPHKITIHNIELLDYDYPFLKIKTKVSSGTYIRSLAYDIGQKLGTGAYLSALKRTQIGGYDLENSVDLENIKTVADLEGFEINNEN